MKTKLLSVFLGIFLEILLCNAQNTKNYFLSASKKNWYEAFQDCALRGLQLATINSHQEQLDIQKLIHENGKAQEWIWISGTDQGKEGVFIWMSTGQPFTYTRFSEGQPDNAGGLENCIHLWPVPGEMAWNDWQCNQVLTYLCEDKSNSNNEYKKMCKNSNSELAITIEV